VLCEKTWSFNFYFSLAWLSVYGLYGDFILIFFCDDMLCNYEQSLLGTYNDTSIYGAMRHGLKKGNSVGCSIPPYITNSENKMFFLSESPGQIFHELPHKANMSTPSHFLLYFFSPLILSCPLPLVIWFPAFLVHLHYIWASISGCMY